MADENRPGGDAVTDPDDKAFRRSFQEVKVLLHTQHDEHHDLVVRHIREAVTHEDLLDVRLFDIRKESASGSTKRGLMLTLEEADQMVTAVLDSGLLEG